MICALRPQLYSAALRHPYVIFLALAVASVTDAGETALGTASVAPTAAGAYYSRLVALGDGFLAIWTEGQECSPELRGIRLDRDGHPRDLRWLDKAAFGPRFARIDANGVLIDPLNGRTVLGSYDDPVLASAPDGWTIAAHEGYGSFGAGRGVALAHIGVDGLVPKMDTAPLSTSAVEAFVLAPSPLVAYKRASSSAAFVGPLVKRSRAVHH
jgi:hypothetical protein